MTFHNKSAEKGAKSQHFLLHRLTQAIWLSLGVVSLTATAEQSAKTPQAANVSNTSTATSSKKPTRLK